MGELYQARDGADIAPAAIELANARKAVSRALDKANGVLRAPGIDRLIALGNKIDLELAKLGVSVAADDTVALSDIADLQRYSLGSPSDWHTGAEMEEDDEGEFVLLADILRLKEKV